MKKEYFILFIILLILSFPNIVNLCKQYIDLSYDYQIFSAWKYSASIHLLPYKDVFFPYGFLTYYKEINWFFAGIYILLTPTIFLGIFILFNKIFKEKIFSYLFLGGLYLFILTITGFEVFTRYGILVVSGCWFALYLYEYKNKLSKWFPFFAGIFSGVVFILSNDVGIYCFVIFLLLLTSDILIRNGLRKALHKLDQLISSVALFSLGYAISLLPFLGFLYNHNALLQFFLSFQDLFELSQFAKTPFIHTLRSIDNIFVLLSIFASSLFIAYSVFYKKIKATKTIYVQLALIFSLIILEQKNIIRSIDSQLTFIGLLLCFFLLYELKTFYTKYNISQKKIFFYFLNIIVIIIFVIPFRTEASVENIIGCKNNVSVIPAVYPALVKDIKELPDFNGNIFSYPADTILYVLLDQPMPYFPTIYEGSSLRAQRKLIEYIETKEVNYIVYNYKNHSVQDKVPNFIRSTFLHTFILNNFHIYKNVDDFLILQRNKQPEDFLIDSSLESLEDFKKQLLQVNLESIPKSEGLFKEQYLKNSNNKQVISVNSISDLNNTLIKTRINSDNALLIVKFKEPINKKSTLTLTTLDGKTTEIKFNSCSEGKYCIIHLARVPLFYKNRVIKEVNIDSIIAKIEVYNISKNHIFW